MKDEVTLNQDKPPSFGGRIIRSIVAAKKHDLVVFLGVVVAIAAGTCGVLKLDLIPAWVYMPEKYRAHLHRSNPPASAPNPEPSAFSIRKPEPYPIETPDDKAIARISPRGMEAVNFMLRYTTASEAEKKKLHEQHNGKTIDWDMVVFANFGITGGKATLVCCPLYFERWSREIGVCYVRARKDFENAFLAQSEEEEVRVKGVLEISEFSMLEIHEATIQRLKPQ